MVELRLDQEWTAPAAAIAAALREPGCWPLANLAAPEWPLHGWLVTPLHQDNQFTWVASHPASERWTLLTLALFPAATSTHVRLTLQLDEPLHQRTWRNREAAQADLAALLATFQARWQPASPAANQPLETTHPLTWAAFAAMDALPELERIQALDARWAAFERGPAPAAPHQLTSNLPPATAEFDLVYAGGGLALLHAALLARQGYRVAVFDRYAVGCAHREWNISGPELERLVATGLIDWPTLERDIIMARYRDGIVRFHPAGSDVPPAELHMPEVLNIALDAGALLRHVRASFVAAGGTVLEGLSFQQVLVDPRQQRVVVEATGADDTLARLGARLLVDGMGATSPLTLATQPFSGICPTVGTIVRGVEHDPEIGDILVSVAGAQNGRQLIWEGFPGRDDELTVYVFYYDQVGARARFKHSLLDLFEDYFELLPSYKQPRRDFAHLRPVYGYIPSRHSVRRPMPLPGVLALGDAAAQQSPLTFCGFGSFVRNLGRLADGLDAALKAQLWQPADLRAISAFQANVSMNWVFSRFMTPWKRPQDVNELQNVFARVLTNLGPDIAQRFFQDQMTWRDYRAIILGTLDVYPAIMRTAWDVLGWADIQRWIVDWLRFNRATLAALPGRRLAPWLERRLRQRAPRLAFRLRMRQAEWQAMGWSGHQARGST